MRIRIGLLLVCLLIVGVPHASAQFRAPDPAPAENFNIELGAMFWKPTPVLNIQTGALAAIGESEVDFVREFAIENKRFTEYRIVAKPGRKHKIRFNYIPFEYNEEATLSRTITFGGRTFDVGVLATADLKWQMWKFGYEWDAFVSDRGFFGIIGELKHNKISADLNSAIGSELTEATAPVPTVGIIGRAYPSRNVSVTAEFTGFKVPGGFSDEFNAKLFDLDIYGTANFGRNVGIQLGYRSLVAEYLVDEDAGNLEMKGIYFGGLLRF
jgi:hypothetical protein